MPRGGDRVGGGRPKARKPRVSPAVKFCMEAEAPPVDTGSIGGQTPLEYMLAVIHDPDADESRRDRLAVAAAPYLHAKVGESGKKDLKNRAASKAGAGKFAPAAAPKLVASGGVVISPKLSGR